MLQFFLTSIVVSKRTEATGCKYQTTTSRRNGDWVYSIQSYAARHCEHSFAYWPCVGGVQSWIFYILLYGGKCCCVSRGEVCQRKIWRKTRGYAGVNSTTAAHAPRTLRTFIQSAVVISRASHEKGIRLIERMRSKSLQLLFLLLLLLLMPTEAVPNLRSAVAIASSCCSACRMAVCATNSPDSLCAPLSHARSTV